MSEERAVIIETGEGTSQGTSTLLRAERTAVARVDDEPSIPSDLR